MNVTYLDLIPIIPEIIILVMACIALLATLYLPEKYRAVSVYYMVQAALILALAMIILSFNEPSATVFNGTFILDNIARILKIFIYLCSFVVLLFSRYYIAERDIANGEYFILAIFSILGMSVLVSAHNFVTIYLGLEMLTLPLYAMVALERDSAECSEAAMKFFVMGALASGILLYGMSMLYGATNSLDITQISQHLGNVILNKHLVLIFGLVFVVVGIVFKFGAVPFHMWVPDVYEGAPSSVTLFISSAPKIAALGLAIRLLLFATPGLYVEWQQFLIIVAVLSMALGNLVAIVQTNLKRMLAYSSIAHMGYMLLGLIAATPQGYSATLFYIISYAIMSVGGFGMIVLLSKKGLEVDTLQDIQGLNSRNPWLAFMMLLIMFSMAGIPPTVGFFAKLGVLQALIAEHFVWLAALALIFAVIGAYYYIRVVKVMYFDEAKQPQPFVISSDVNLAISVTGLVVLALGLFPGMLFSLCHLAF